MLTPIRGIDMAAVKPNGAARPFGLQNQRDDIRERLYPIGTVGIAVFGLRSPRSRATSHPGGSGISVFE
jgi:hypothetical protein